MEKSKIYELAKELSEKINIPIECDKGNCGYEKSKENFCCQVGAYYKIHNLLEKGINEGIRKDASTVPTDPSDKAKYSVQLQHNGHNELDKLSDALYRFDKFNKENKSGHINFVTAEYMRSAIINFRYILNELYLNGKS